METGIKLRNIDPSGTIDFAQWQIMVDLLCRLASVKSAAITRLNLPEIEAFLVSSNPGNPFYEGLTVELANHYCEAVINEKKPLMVSNAVESKRWSQAPEIEHDLISYMGYPLRLPSGKIFGTLCIHDNKENFYSEEIKLLMDQFSQVIESHFQMAKQTEELKKALENVKQLEGLLPICSHCKQVRDDRGYWIQIESYISAHSDTLFSHGICPECAKKYYPEFDFGSSE
ncbi:MAG: GAF domain-containing protein [Desulfobulbaceae bacterium]|nr:GAF domain-containing protein [Desulfobulbaceae bacterium]